MKPEYILYPTVIIITITFIVLLFMLLQNTKKKMVNNKIRKCIEDKIHNKVSAHDIQKMIKYIDKNKKYVLFSTYGSSLQTLRRVLLRI